MRYSHNQVMVDNYLFDSEQEANYYGILKDRQAKGEIFDLKVHPEFVLIPPFVYEGKQIKATVYTPDFSYSERPANAPDLLMPVAVEVKGYPTPDYELRVKLFKANFPLVHLIVMQFSKGTGWLERTDYLKARKKINAANAIDRFEKRKGMYESVSRRYRENLEKAQFEIKQCHTEKGIAKAQERIERCKKKIESLEAKWQKERSK